MKEIFLEIVNTYLIPALATFLTGFIAWLGTKVKEIYNEKVQDKTKREIIEKVVKYVEQKFKESESTEKYQKALEQAEVWFASKGLTINEVEIETLIESAVYELTKKEE